jgi:DNA replication initiation complex subunit (GINS family)
VFWILEGVKRMDYTEIYEILRKEKYDEKLQALPKGFLSDFSKYLNDMKSSSDGDEDLFSDSTALGKKQLENAISLFKELILRRKRKLLNLVFVAAETGIMKRDYENLLDVERDTFDRMLKAFEEGDKEVTKILAGREGKEEKHRMIMFNQDVEEFVDFDGKAIGPYSSGSLVNLDSKVAQTLVEGGKGNYVDED